jgi:predicted outer membrane protein
MTLTFPLSVMGLVLFGTAAWAADFSAELDFLTRASNSNLFAIEESRLAIDRTGDPKVKTFAGRMVEDHGARRQSLKLRPKGPAPPSQRCSTRSIRRA